MGLPEIRYQLEHGSADGGDLDFYQLVEFARSTDKLVWDAPWQRGQPRPQQPARPDHYGLSPADLDELDIADSAWT
jgi:hypothetical protein